jgi:hypothetical protein
MSYDLRRLRLHGIIERIPGSHRYQITPDGRRHAMFPTRLHHRVIATGLDDLVSTDDEAPALRKAANAYDTALGQLLHQARLAPDRAATRTARAAARHPAAPGPATAQRWTDQRPQGPQDRQRAAPTPSANPAPRTDQPRAAVPAPTFSVVSSPVDRQVGLGPARDLPGGQVDGDAAAGDGNVVGDGLGRGRPARSRPGFQGKLARPPPPASGAGPAR